MVRLDGGWASDRQKASADGLGNPTAIRLSQDDRDDSRHLSPAPQARQQLAAIAELRWRIFVNSLRTFRGRLELVSRIFIGLAFVAGGIGGAIGLGGAAWFLISEGNPEWLGALLWPVFLSGSSFL